MPSAWCLIKPLADDFRAKLKSGEIDPVQLSQMTSEERHKFFADMMGDENAKNVNSLFESKLLLKNQQQGMITWAKKVAGISKPAQKDLIAKISRMDQVFNPKEGQPFLNDLASTALGANVTQDEAKKIFDLSKNVQDLKQSMIDHPTDKQTRIDYGNAILDTMDYLHEINPKKASLIANLINLPRSLVASLDFVSAPFRHGWGMTSRADFWKNYVNMPKYAFSEKAFRNKMADIVSRPTYDLMKNGKLSIFGFSDTLSQREEQFMSNILDHFPITRGSARAYMGFLNGLRADAFDHMLHSAQLAGEDISKNSQTVKDIAAVVNNFTGAANLGRFESIDPYLNNILFSPRKMVATIQMFNPQFYATLTPTARGQALRNLIGSVGITTTLLTLGHMAGAEVTTDPTSSDFGQLKIGNTRIDLTGGNRTYATLLARLITGKYTSATTGVTKDLGSGFGQISRADMAVSYFRNKLAPTASAITDWLYGKDITGKAFNVTDEAMKLLMPMNITDGLNIMNQDQGNSFMGIVLGLFGLPVSSYSAQSSWQGSTSKSIQQFQQSTDQKTFDQANKDYNDSLNTNLKKLQADPRYQQMNQQQQAAMVTKLKKQVEDKIFKQYGFKPTRAKKSKSTKIQLQ